MQLPLHTASLSLSLSRAHTHTHTHTCVLSLLARAAGTLTLLAAPLDIFSPQDFEIKKGEERKEQEITLELKLPLYPSLISDPRKDV